MHQRHIPPAAPSDDNHSRALSKFKIFAMKKIVFKIMAAADWAEATITGLYKGSQDDRRDGFIHLSEQHQLAGTLEKHFKGKDDLVIIAFEASELGPQLKWEVSRGGELFPHLYGDIAASQALWHRPMSLDGNGVPQLEEEWFVC
jgi:uncharacterized protein (DUF952 family)